MFESNNLGFEQVCMADLNVILVFRDSAAELIKGLMLFVF